MSFDHPHRCGTAVLSRVSVRFSPLVVFIVVTVRGLDHLGWGRLLQPGPNPQQPAGDSPDGEHRNDDPQRSRHGAIVRLRPAVWADTAFVIAGRSGPRSPHIAFRA